MPVHTASGPPTSDERTMTPSQTLNTPRTFPHFRDLAEWKARRTFIREQVLVSCGLYPLPRKTALKARVFGRVERDGYSIEKVYIQTYPGFYLCGNLYRPHPTAGKPSGPYPGILVAHGHWSEGRMADTPDGSIPARAITFAREGAVAFSYDMVGYNDTRQINHQFANDRRHWLWGVSLMGLQTWNSIRALDFLSSLPDVDKNRLASTGESGGGTQTMLLGAVDDRLAAVAPCVMVSHTMQGGCLCENAPGLRIEFSNMELAAMAAPRPQIMVAATGDWTKTMMTVEGPAVQSVYDLYGDADRLKYVIFDYGHNINKTSREAVDRFFGKWLLHDPDVDSLHEPPYTMEPVADLRVFPDKLPPDAKDADALTAYLIAKARDEIEKRKPVDRASLARFKKLFLPEWKHTLSLMPVDPDDILASEQPSVETTSGAVIHLTLGRAGRGDSIPAALFLPPGKRPRGVIVIAHPAGMAASMDTATGQPGPVVTALLAKGQAALVFDAFLTGSRADEEVEAARKPFENFFTTYNRTDLQERIQDIATVCAYLRKSGFGRVALLGEGRAGLWTLLAAPLADAVAADGDQTNLSTDDALLLDDLFVPCLRRIGDFRTAAVLAAPHPLLLQNTGRRFPAAKWIRGVYASLSKSSALRVSTRPVSIDDQISWLVRHIPH